MRSAPEQFRVPAHPFALVSGSRANRTIADVYSHDCLKILRAFAQRKSLVRLWLWRIPFSSLQPQEKRTVKEVVLALSYSIYELGLYRCSFSCYEEMVSFVRAFPHCDKLYIQDCMTDGQDTPENSFAEFPQYKLSIVDLDVTASSMDLVLLIDPFGAHRRRRTGRLLARQTCLRFVVCGGDSSRYFSHLQVAHSGISVFLVLLGRVPGYVHKYFST